MFDKLYCFIFNKPYFDCVIRKNGIKVGELIQKEPNAIKGGDICLISKKFKMAWFKPISPMYFRPVNSTDESKISNDEKLLSKSSGIIFVDGNRFFCVLDMENAIPLYEEISVLSETQNADLIVKVTTKSTLKCDASEIKKKGHTGKAPDGMPVRLKPLDFIPAMLFELLNANFVTLVMQKPKSKYEELVPVFLAAIIMIGFLVWYVTANGIVHI